MRSIHRGLGVILLAALPLCAGCAGTQHISMQPSVAEEIRSLKVVSVIPQSQPEAHVQQATSGGAMFGLIGALVDAGVTSSRKSETDDLLLALRAECKEFDFREMFWNEMETVLNASVWPAEFELTRTSDKFGTKELEEAIASNDKDGLLLLRTEYFLTPSVNVLVLRTTAELYRYNVKKREYLGQFGYFSDEVIPYDMDDKKRKAADLWAADQAAKFKDYIRRGVLETTRMVQYDLIERKTEDNTGGRKYKFTYEDPDGMAKAKTLKANLITQVSGRAFFRGEKGNLFSMPDAWMVVLDTD